MSSEKELQEEEKEVEATPVNSSSNEFFSDVPFSSLDLSGSVLLL